MPATGSPILLGMGKLDQHTAPPETVTGHGGGDDSPKMCPECEHEAIQKPYKKVFLDRLFERLFKTGPRPAFCQVTVHGYSGYNEPCYCEHPSHGS